MITFARLLVFPALVVTSLAATAAPVRYALDPVHTRVLFAVEHSGFSKALGTVSGSNGTLVFDPDDWAAARLDVTVPLRRADLGDAKWTNATLARNLLDAERFPDAHFVSTRVEASGQNHAKVTGNLTLRGVTRPVTLEVTLNALKRHPLPPFRRTAGFSATATLSRAEFGIDAWKSMIGDTVELRIEAEAVREGRDDDAPEPQTIPAMPDAAASPES
ncbi:YceI family protein [Xanthomonas fragariae]|uniref:YceI family protein n=1 Tax=Xanthomonas fragariae TaxID=48664 RepID=UPI0022AA846C|nr:YceI family protein [Xanthomonas fragariae]WAT15687.1 YceI family protein [Xanthomonas fragariae]